MMKEKHLVRLKKLAAAGMVGTVLQFGGCDLSEFTATTTTTTTLDGRQVIQSLVLSLILDPIQDFITTGVDNFFDSIEGENG